MRSLEVLSYNIEFGKRLDKVVDWAAHLDPQPDIFCFQEFPQEQLKAVEGISGEANYSFEYAPAIVKHGSTFGELTAYRNDALTLIDSHVVNLGMYPLEQKAFKLSGERSALVTSFDYEGTEFTVANIHLLWLSPHNNRLKQLATIIASLGNAQSALVIGDYNYSSFVGKNRLVAYMKENGFLLAGKPIITHRIKGLVPHQLDYVFQKNCMIREVTVFDAGFSDHLPISAKIDLK